MRKLLCTAFLAAVVLSLGCAVTDYPVITDARGGDNGVMQSFYDKAYIIPSGAVATIWDDGTDELYSQVTQDWKGDQWLYTYNNFDPTAAVTFLDQTYCDPVRQTNCSIATTFNPDDASDVDPFDYTYDTSCSGARSLSLLVSYTSRIGECGSGIWGDQQAAAFEFSQLERTNFRGHEYYSLPIDNSVASFSLTGADGAKGVMPVYGRFNGYVDNKLRTAFPVTPNAKMQLRFLDNWVNAHGNNIDVDATYGSLTATFKLHVTTVDAALNRL